MGKEWRLLNVGAVSIPFIDVAVSCRDFVPFWILFGEIAIKFAKDFRLESGLHLVADFLEGRPDFAQKDLFAIFAFANGIFAQIDVHPPGESESHHERWRHEEIRLDALMDAGFEIAIAGKDGGGNEIVFRNGIIDG